MNHSKLPDVLPAQTWIRTVHGPSQTYREAKLVRPGEAGRYGISRRHVYQSGGPGSDLIDFSPELVLWDAVESVEARQQIEKICRDFYALGVQR